MKGGAGKALAGAIGVLALAGAVAYAAAARDAPGTTAVRGQAGPELPRPAITRHPEKVSTSTSASFGFDAGRRLRRFQCRLDRRGWRSCRSPIAFAKLAPGKHVFAVRGLDDRGRRTAAARFRWTLLEPKGFVIVPQLSGIGDLYPGAAPVALPVTITNPNPVPIMVTSLRVAVTADPPACTSAENLLLVPAGLSGAAPLRVPANGSASLPAPGVSPPAIQLRDLPVNQDACQNARFPLAFSGEAHG